MGDKRQGQEGRGQDGWWRQALAGRAGRREIKGQLENTAHARHDTGAKQTTRSTKCGSAFGDCGMKDGGVQGRKKQAARVESMKGPGIKRERGLGWAGRPGAAQTAADEECIPDEGSVVVGQGALRPATCRRALEGVAAAGGGGNTAVQCRKQVMYRQRGILYRVGCMPAVPPLGRWIGPGGRKKGGKGKEAGCMRWMRGSAAAAERAAGQGRGRRRAGPGCRAPKGGFGQEQAEERSRQKRGGPAGRRVPGEGSGKGFRGVGN